MYVHNLARRIVRNTVPRVQAITDIAKLNGDLYKLPSTELKYCRAHADTPVPELGPRHSRVHELEFLRVWLLTTREPLPNTCQNLNELAEHAILRTVAIDTSYLMIKLGEPEYIKLNCTFNVRTGNLQVPVFVCESENVGLSTALNDEDTGIWFDGDAIFKDVITAKFNEVFKSSELDMGSYCHAFKSSGKALDIGHSFTVYIGSPDSQGHYHEERYSIADIKGERVLARIERNMFDQDRSSWVLSDEVIPWMVAVLASSLPGEDKFLVQYDPEEKSIAILPGDPYGGTDTLAEVLSESGAGISDGSHT